MKRFGCLEIAGILHDIAILETALESQMLSGGAAAQVDDFNRRRALEDAKKAIAACSPYAHMYPAVNAAQRCAAQIGRADRPITFGALQIAVQNVREAIFDELRRECSVLVPRHYAEWVDNENLFGSEVSATFPNAVHDIRDAGNCIAIGLNTAAVFHAMRVAEHGLKWLAKKLRVKLAVNKKPIAVSEATWGTIIDGVRKRIGAARQLRGTPKKREQLEQYARAGDHCDYMKDIWRNAVSHAHKEYMESEAKVAVDRVKEFMQLLARMP